MMKDMIRFWRDIKWKLERFLIIYFICVYYIQNKFLYRRYLMMYELVETKQEVTSAVAWKESHDNILTKNIDRSPEISWRNLSFSIQDKNLLKNCWGKVNVYFIFRLLEAVNNQPTLLQL